MSEGTAGAARREEQDLRYMPAEATSVRRVWRGPVAARKGKAPPEGGEAVSVVLAAMFPESNRRFIR